MRWHSEKGLGDSRVIVAIFRLLRQTEISETECGHRGCDPSVLRNPRHTLVSPEEDPRRFQFPPSTVPLKLPNIWAGPPETSTFLSSLRTPDAIYRLSGLQKNGDILTDSALGTGRASSEASERIHNSQRPSGSVASKANRRPSGESANGSCGDAIFVSGTGMVKRLTQPERLILRGGERRLAMLAGRWARLDRLPQNKRGPGKAPF